MTPASLRAHHARRARWSLASGRDTYPTVIAELDVERAKAQATANLVPRRRQPAA